MSDKKIYMRIEDEQTQQDNSIFNQKIKDEIKEQPIEAALQSALEGISMKSVNGIINITIPEPAFQILSAILTKLIFSLEKKDREIER